jgi:maltose alpha-D-glucosyltransferase / alpha-amylase
VEPRQERRLLAGGPPPAVHAAIHHGPYQFEFVNVEDAEAQPHSLLHFTRRMLAFRNQHARTFGRGSMRVLPVENQAVLAFVREHEGDRVLVVANLSRFAQSAFLPPDGLDGLVPDRDALAGAVPGSSRTPYHLPLAPHQFYWFALVPEEAVARGSTAGCSPSPPSASVATSRSSTSPRG